MDHQNHHSTGYAYRAGFGPQETLVTPAVFQNDRDPRIDAIPSLKTVTLHAAPRNHEKLRTHVQTLREVTVSREQLFLSFEFAAAVNVGVHHLPQAQDWTAGPVRCLKDGCPACKAGIPVAKNIVIPAVDRMAGDIVLFRYASERRPGSLATELDKILINPRRNELTACISRVSHRAYCVTTTETEATSSALARKIARFSEDLLAKRIDLTSALFEVGPAELATHPSVAAPGAHRSPETLRGEETTLTKQLQEDGM